MDPRPEEHPAVDPGFIERLAAFVGKNAGAETVYGTPVEKNGVTVIPVAKVRWGFGGGDGTGPGGAAQGSGSGGGGGVMARPLGFIEIGDSGAEFRRINDPAALAPAVLAGGLAGLLLLRGLRKTVKTAKRS